MALIHPADAAQNHTVAQLKTLLTERGLPTDGLKAGPWPTLCASTDHAVLLARLLEHESSSAANGSAAPAAPADASSDAKPAASSTPAPAAAPAPATASAPASSSAPAQTAEEKAAADEAKRQARAAKFGAVPDAEKPSLNGELAGGRRAKDKAAAPASAPKEPAAKVRCAARSIPSTCLCAAEATGVKLGVISVFSYARP